jgi:hypothetical protein
MPWISFTYADKEDLQGPQHANPDVVRWELHRVWVVDATFKPGKRHIYPHCYISLDEDSWAGVTFGCYDAKKVLFKLNCAMQAPNCDVPSPNAQFFLSYDCRKIRHRRLAGRKGI